MDMPLAILDRLCPLHVVLDAGGHVVQTGPTIAKLDLGLDPGTPFLKRMEIYRPEQVVTMEELHAVAGRKLHLRKIDDAGLQLKGVFVPGQAGGGVIDLSFGIHVKDAVRDHALTSTDFSPIDISIDLLYLIEANAAAMQASRRLNDRLQTAMFAAEERALTDMLTGLSNRRAMELLQNRLHRAGREYALMHIDLDFFKAVNDTLGHAAGDAVLRAVSRAMLQEIRKEDTVARIGGDEFVIVFPNAMTYKRLGDLAERLIRRIEQPVDVGGEICKVSASIGVALCQDAVATPEQILHNADVALYEAKRAGRGQYRHYHYDRSDDALPPQIRAGGN